MTRSLLPSIAAVALVAAAAAPGAAPASPARPMISLSATPSHLTLVGREPQALVVRNEGATRVGVVAQRAAFAFDVTGNAVIAPRPAPRRSASTWLAIRPRRLVLAPGRSGVVRISARPAPHARPGDHHALVLLSALAPRHTPVSIRTRLGVLVFVRVPGHIARRLEIAGVRPASDRGRRRLLVSVVNHGDVAERLLPAQLTIALSRQGHVVALGRGQPRDLLPHTRGLFSVRLGRSLRGRFTAVVRIAALPGWTAGPRAPALPAARKTLSLRL